MQTEPTPVAQPRAPSRPLLETPMDQMLRLHDGRILSYREYGDAAGAPVFYFHGWPGSRFDFSPNDAAARRAGVRVIAVDRPGIGRSDPQPGRTVLDWAHDVAEMASALAIDRFYVLGFSFGGAYARACAYALPKRVIRAGLVACLGPADDPATLALLPAPSRLSLLAARVSPLLARPMVALTGHMALTGKLVDQLAKSMSAADRSVLERKDVRDALGLSFSESFRQLTADVACDGVAVATGDGFRLEDVTAEVLVWHGEQDKLDPVSMARGQARRLPRVRAFYYPEDGHLILFSRIDEILRALVER